MPPQQVSRSMVFRFIKRKSFVLFLLLCMAVLIVHNMSGINSPKKPKHRNNLFPEAIKPYSDYNSHKPKPNSNSNLNGKANGNANANGKTGQSSDSKLSSSSLSSSVNTRNSQKIKDFIEQLYQLKPDQTILGDKANQLEFTNADPPNGLITKTYLKSQASIPQAWVEEVKSKHSLAVSFINTEVLADSQKDEEPESASSKHGAVIIGGAENDYTWLALISTRLFRKAGGVLPIEVMLPTKEDYLKDREICDLYLPQLNAKCVIIKDLLDASTATNAELDDDLNKYIWNNFTLIKRELAILLSRFENVLFLSPENVMLKPMEYAIFDKQFYKDFGLFVWGDYGARTTLPAFYEIADLEVKNAKTSVYGLPLTEELISKSAKLTSEELSDGVNFHDLENSLPYKQSDASELIIDKKQHLGTLLLSLYYNLNGPDAYYVLLTGRFDGAHGAKETILAAAHVLSKQYYLINSEVESNGYWYDDEFKGVSMMQFDPIVDYYSYEAFIDKFSRKEGYEVSYNKYQRWLKESSERRSPLFLNINNPPLKPIELIQQGTVVKENGDRVRLIADTSYFDAEFETDIWRVMNDYICHLSLECSYVKTWFGKGNSKKRDAFCKGDIKEHLLWVSSLGSTADADLDV